METAPRKASDSRRLMASSEGYLALAIVIFGFFFPRVDHPTNTSILGAIACTGIAFGLAFGGIRFGNGGGRFAAMIALGILTLFLLILFTISITHWEEVVWYWSHAPIRRGLRLF